MTDAFEQIRKGKGASPMTALQILPIRGRV
jgi:hypothetical protein